MPRRRRSRREKIGLVVLRDSNVKKVSAPLSTGQQEGGGEMAQDKMQNKGNTTTTFYFFPPFNFHFYRQQTTINLGHKTVILSCKELTNDIWKKNLCAYSLTNSIVFLFSVCFPLVFTLLDFLVNSLFFNFVTFILCFHSWLLKSFSSLAPALLLCSFL